MSGFLALTGLLQIRWAFLKPSGLSTRNVSFTSLIRQCRTRRARILCQGSGIRQEAEGLHGQRKPILPPKVQSAKEMVLRLEPCEPSCRSQRMLPIEGCDCLELGGGKMRIGLNGPALD